jgi:GTP-binding protein
MIDIAKITVKAGNGGSGGISFRREKYVPQGGPDGGDGGAGGNIIVQASDGLHMLRAFRYKRMFKADDGSKGKGKNKAGRTGKDCIINVPSGTTITRIDLGGEREELGDLVTAGSKIIVQRGGGGGKGNAKFTNPQNRVPLLAEDGDIPQEIIIELEIQVLADVAIIGMPSVGKSSMLRVCSRAKPDVAAYPFTTLEPVLGFVERHRQEFILAEIPGLIEGAHNGAGLGYEFLRHMQRVSGIVHVLDGTSESIVQDYLQVREEMRLYDERLQEKPELVVVNKMDTPEVQVFSDEIDKSLKEIGLQVQFISAATGEGIEDVLDKVIEMLATLPSVEGAKVKPIPVLKPRSEINGASVRKVEGAFIVKSARAERIVRRVDLEDWGVQAQLWGEFKRIGVVRALEKAGAKSGATVKIGDVELEWK